MIDEDVLDKLPLAKRIEVSENVLRKNFTVSEMWDVIDAVHEELEEKALQRMKLGKPSSDSDQGRTDEKIASMLQISRDQYHKIVDIKNAVKKNPEKYANLVNNVDSGKTSINYAWTSINNTERQEIPTPDLPDDIFDLIEMDVPWAYDLPLVGSPPYKTMTLEEIQKEIPKIPAHKDCILFMWATNPKLKEALKLMEFYGFEYKTNLVWIKEKDGKIQTNVGYYVKGAHELLLIGTRGSPGVPAEIVRVPSVVKAPRTQHSVKPDIFYEIIETYYPGKKKLSMYSRRQRKNWSVWGDTIESD